MYVCMYIHIHTYTYTHIHIYIYAHIHGVPRRVASRRFFGQLPDGVRANVVVAEVSRFSLMKFHGKM